MTSAVLSLVGGGLVGIILFVIMEYRDEQMRYAEEGFSSALWLWLTLTMEDPEDSNPVRTALFLYTMMGILCGTVLWGAIYGYLHP